MLYIDLSSFQYFCQILGSRLAEVPIEEEFEFIRGFALEFEGKISLTFLS